MATLAYTSYSSKYILSRPDSRSDPIGGSEPSSGCETIYWDYLPFFFFFFITESKYHIHIQKNYHRSGDPQNLYTYTESHLHIQNCTFTFTNQSTEPTSSEPLLVCWPSCMRMFQTSSPVPTRIKNPSLQEKSELETEIRDGHLSVSK